MAECRSALSGPGEALFAAYADGSLAGICGLNVDPFADDPQVARVRHLYVVPVFRREGIGTALLNTVLEAAQRAGFSEVRLRTDMPAAARFYESRGFGLSTVGTATHVRRF